MVVPTTTSARPSPLTSPTTSAVVVPGWAPKATESLTGPSAKGRVLMARVRTASRPTPGTFIRTRPVRVPASPPVLPGEAPVMTSRPTPSDSVTTSVVPSPKPAVTLRSATRTTSVPPLTAFSSTMSPETRWPAISIRMPVPSTRR